MKDWYKSLEKRYTTFPKDIQVLNMVSDLQKAANLKSVNSELMRNHLYRATILLDYIINDPKWRNALGELLRLREVICSVIEGIDYAPLEQVIRAALLLDSSAYKRIKGIQVTI